jgi:hypothetical protein
MPAITNSDVRTSETPDGMMMVFIKISIGGEPVLVFAISDKNDFKGYPCKSMVVVFFDLSAA